MNRSEKARLKGEAVRYLEMATGEMVNRISAQPYPHELGDVAVWKVRTLEGEWYWVLNGEGQPSHYRLADHRDSAAAYRQARRREVARC